MIERIDKQLDSLLDRQKQAWHDGDRPAVLDLLADSSLQENSEAQLDLIYNEIVLREELGEQPTEEEYSRRFPHLRIDLERQFEVHRAVHDRLMTETARLNGTDTLPEVSMPAGGLGPNLPDYEVLQILGEGGMGQGPRI